MGYLNDYLDQFGDGNKRALQSTNFKGLSTAYNKKLDLNSKGNKMKLDSKLTTFKKNEKMLNFLEEKPVNNRLK